MHKTILLIFLLCKITNLLIYSIYVYISKMMLSQKGRSMTLLPFGKADIRRRIRSKAVKRIFAIRFATCS